MLTGNKHPYYFFLNPGGPDNMNNKNIINTLKKDIKEIKHQELKPLFRRYTLKEKYAYHIDLHIRIIKGTSVFTKTIRPVRFRTRSGANNLIILINKQFNANLKPFNQKV